MFPPVDYQGAKLLSATEFRDWEIYRSFDTKTECKTFRANHAREVARTALAREDEGDAWRELNAGWKAGTAAKIRRLSLDRALKGVCIDQDDPRLKLR